MKSRTIKLYKQENTYINYFDIESESCNGVPVDVVTDLRYKFG